MKGKSKITSTLLALILSVTMIVTYMPASMIAYAANEADVAAEIEQSDTGTDVVTDDVLDSSEEADEADPAVSESNEQEEDAADVVDGDGADVIGEDQVDSAEVIPEEETDAEAVTEVEPKRATKATKTGTVLAFSSDVHNKSNNTAANRLDTWIKRIVELRGGIDVMAFGGDMADANASSSSFWTLTEADMAKLTANNITGVYTTGNHEYSPGGYSASSTNATQQAYKINTQGAEGSNYRIYCLGSNSSSSSYANQVSSLQSYLDGVGNDKVIFIITHFPLHYYNSYRTTKNASDVIDVLNNAVTKGTEDTSDDRKIVFLWGHNHTEAPGETHYDEIFKPGDSLQYASGSSNTKTIQFYYAAAGCMSDSEYGTGSGAVEGKGLVVDINSKNQLKFTYYDENGNDVTEGGAFTEQDPVAATGISIDEITQTGDDGQPVVIESPTIEAGKRLQLSVTIEPADATNKDVTWSSSDPSIATVSSTGLVKGVSPGTATITASISDTAKRGTLTASIEVTITERTSEEQYYVIKIGDYALSSRTSSDRMTNTSGYEYYGLEGVEYSSAQAAPYKILWTLEPADGVENGFYIKSADGDYLSASYVRNSSSSSSYTGTLTLGNAEDIWIATSGLDAWEVEGSTLKSNNASHNANNDKEMFLADIEGDAGSNLFTVRSSSDSSVNRTSTLVEPEETLAKVSVTGITLNPTALSVEEGKTATITANVVPTNADDTTVTWTSSSPSVATVDTAGKVTGVAEGNTTITARTQDGDFTATCSVTVTPRTTPRYELTNSLEDGGEYLIVSTRSPGSAYALKNPGTSGTNIANASYKTSVTIQSDQTVYIETEDADVVWTATTNGSGFNLTNNGLYLEGSGGNVGVYSSLNNSDRSWSYSSGNQLQHLGGSSTYTLRYRSSSNYFQGTTTANNSYTVFLFKKLSNAAVTGIMLDKSTADVSINGTVQLTATVEPANAGNKEVSWGSSDTSVATVDNTGKVTGVAEGTATITATSAADPSISASCVVTVSDVHVDDVSISPSPANVSINNSVQLTANITPENASNKNVTWASSDSSIATVDNSGKVTGVSEGEATITVTTEDGGKIAICTVTVTKQKAYVIIIGDYALSTDSSGDELVNSGSGSQVYHYHGLAGVEYTAGSAATDNIRWFLEETEGGYYIKSQDGRYLNATYGTNSTGGSDGVLKLDETKDVWVLDGTLESWALNGSKLKSTNANKSLTHEETSNGNAINLFTVRSTGEETSLIEAGDPVAVTGVTVTPETAEVSAGQTVQLAATVSPENATNKGVEWSSGDNSVATVDETGKVTGVAEGTAVITATTVDGSYSASCTISVTEPAPAEGDRYEEVNSLEDGKEYILAVTKDDGSVYAINNPGSSPTNTLTLTVNTASGNTSAYIVTNESGVAWKYAASNKYCNYSGPLLNS